MEYGYWVMYAGARLCMALSNSKNIKGNSEFEWKLMKGGKNSGDGGPSNSSCCQSSCCTLDKFEISYRGTIYARKEGN